MSDLQRLRLWRRLFVPPLAAWAVTGLLLVLLLEGVLDRPLGAERVHTLESEGRMLAALLEREPDRGGASVVDLLFRDPPDGDRLLLTASDGRVLADSDRDSSLWLVSPRAVVRASRGWSILPVARASAGEQRLRVRLAGAVEGGDVELVLARRFPSRSEAAAKVLRGFLFYWLAFGAVLIGAGWFGVGRIHEALRDLRRRIREIVALEGVRDEPNVRETGAPEPIPTREAPPDDPFDLAWDLDGVRRRVERELSESRAEIRARESVFEGMAEGLLAIDVRHTILLMNRPAGRILGVPFPAPAGVRLSEVVRWSRLLRFVDEMLASKQPGTLDLEIEGGRRFLQVRGTVLVAPDGSSRGLILVLTDVSDLRRLEQIRKEFVDNVSHELKTPLTTLRGYVETLVDGAHEDATTRVTFLRTIQANVERMHRIVEDLLSLSRIESQGREIEQQANRAGEMLARVVEELRPEADRRQVRLAVVDDVGPEMFLAATFLLERALINLGNNAIKYGGSGKLVRFRCARSGDDLMWEVTDEGPGIAASHLSRLFERFYRIDRGRSRELGGTGLGLAIVKHVALAHGGEASVESALGRGSTFRIRIPWVPVSVVAAKE